MAVTGAPPRLRRLYLRAAGIPIEYDLERYRRELGRCDAVDTSSHTDSELRAAFDTIRRQALAGEDLDAMLPQAFALTREVCHRTLGLRAFDVQMMAARRLHPSPLAQP